MLVTLGFLLAVLLGLAVMPVYRKRVERLTTQALRSAMPLTEAEIRADKDRLRAGYAIQIHDLEERVEKTTLLSARQNVEINRRDGMITELRNEAKRQSTDLEEHENARRVLEQTIMDRLPKVEQRLAEAKKLLLQRDREISGLTEAADRQSRALEETTQINTQNRDEIHRLQAALTTRAARNREGLGDPRFDSEVALRSEMEALRAKTRDQEQMITKLQALVSRAGGVNAMSSLNGSNGKQAGPQANVDEEISRLRQQLSKAEASLRDVQGSTTGEGASTRRQTEAAMRQMKSDIEDQELEINRLNSALKAYQESERKDTALAEGKMAMKSRIAALQSQTEGQATTIQALRAEVAATNERLARQASHYMEELRKVGAGTRSPVDVHNLVKTSESLLASEDEAVVMSPGARSAPSPGSTARVSDPRASLSLTDRITEPRQRATGAIAGGPAPSEPANDLEPAGGPVRGATEADQPHVTATQNAAEELADTAAVAAPVPRSGGLLERITRLDRTK
ncbi:MAG: hypothetical protein AAFR75_00590 [Pseudomonadota bacterium]